VLRQLLAGCDAQVGDGLAVRWTGGTAVRWTGSGLLLMLHLLWLLCCAADTPQGPGAAAAAAAAATGSEADGQQHVWLPGLQQQQVGV
jgi:hypothetical protein